MPEIQRLILDNLFDGVYFVDAAGIITYWNKSAELITGYSADETVGKKCSNGILRHISLDGQPLCETGCPLQAVLKEGVVCDTSMFLHHKKGHRTPVTARMTPIIAEDGSITGAVEVFCNVSSKKDIVCQIEEIRKEAVYDSLTGAYNRKHADVSLFKLHRDYKEDNNVYGVLFVDLDHFKSINDTFGHDAGDKVLKMACDTIKNSLRDIDMVCRYGGEEFLVLIPNIPLECLDKLADRIRIFISESWITINNQEIRVTASIGGTVSKNGDSMKGVVKRADQLMYRAKNQGRNKSIVE